MSAGEDEAPGGSEGGEPDEVQGEEAGSDADMDDAEEGQHPDAVPGDLPYCAAVEAVDRQSHSQMCKRLEPDVPG